MKSETMNPPEPTKKPTTYKIGDAFEKHTSKLFPDDNFTILSYTPSCTILEGRRIESKKDPDFQFRYEKTGLVFWVECKFRSHLHGKRLHWSNYYQMNRYKKHEANTGQPVFIMVGLGGTPKDPSEKFFIPLKHITYPKLYPSKFKDFKIKHDNFYDILKYIQP